MSRTQRALGMANMDAYARSMGLRDAAEYVSVLKLHRKLDSGGRLTAADIETAHLRGGKLNLTHEDLNQITDYVNSASGARDRADRYAACVSNGVERVVGRPVNHEFARDLVRREGEALEVREYSDPLANRLHERDAHRDRQNGIDAAKRVEEAKRAALANPDNQRRADIEREFERHAGPTPKFLAHDRRELLAQKADHNAERYMQHIVRDTDPNRRPDRADDRSADISLALDSLTVEDAAHDEIALRSNPLLEQVDNALTASGEET